MGYYMKQRKAEFHIPKAKFQAVLTALKGFYAENDGEFVDPENVIRACENNDIEKAFYYARWRVQIDATGIIGIAFNGKKLGNEEALFSAIADSVEGGSYIEMTGEDGNIWRWRFDGECCHEENAKLDFSESMTEEEPKEEKKEEEN